MVEPYTHLALDLGAESGRAMLGILADDRLDLQEIHRFPNGACPAGGRLYWDALRLWSEIKTGLSLAWGRTGGKLASVGIDTWGVDFGLVDQRGELLGNPVHYRDSRTNGIFERAFEIVPREEIFRQTGIQFLPFNTLFQLLAMRCEGSPSLEAADGLLMMPDLFNYWLTGRRSQEFTNATTTQCHSAATKEWAWPLIDAFGLPRRLFGEISPPGSILGPLRGDVADELGFGGVPVALPATHDTGSAVIAVPAQVESWAFISCGTWALIGAETKSPIIHDDSLAGNFTNEGGAFGTNRLLSNVMGLWLLRGARKSWSRSRADLSYEEITAAAEISPAFSAWIDPDDPSFFNPPDMMEAISAFCRKTGQSPPESIGATARCIFESLALKYRLKLQQIENMLGHPVEALHVVGGGSRNRILCQATSDACGRTVIAGPAEATAMGNVLMQAAALGRIRDLAGLRSVARNSAPPQVYHPREDLRDRWDQAYASLDSWREL